MVESLVMSRRRFFGLDILRLLFFQGVAVFHYMNSVWPLGLDWNLPTHYYLGRFLQVFSFSGFAIVFITGFLNGYRSEVRNLSPKFILFLFFGWVVFSFLYSFFSPELSVAN
jgi:hypothetical protein